MKEKVIQNIKSAYFRQECFSTIAVWAILAARNTRSLDAFPMPDSLIAEITVIMEGLWSRGYDWEATAEKVLDIVAAFDQANA